MWPRASILLFTQAVLIAALTLAQTHEPPPDGSVEATALTRARSAAWDQVAALRIEADLTVGQWASRAVEVDRALRAWVRSRPPLGPARAFSDGSCDVDVFIAPAELLARLSALNGHLPASMQVDAATLHGAGSRWAPIWATGSAARPTAADGGAARESTHQPPVGWEDITPRGVELARRGAFSAAVAEMLDQTAALKLTPSRALRALLDSHPALRRDARLFLESAAEISVELGPDQVAQAEATIELVELARGLNEIARRHALSEFETDDFRQMVLLSGNRTPRGVGLSIAPAGERSVWPPRVWLTGAREWAARTLSASGVAQTDRALAAPLVLAESLALLEQAGALTAARHELRKQAQNLPVAGGMTLGGLAGYDEVVRTDLETSLRGARLMEWRRNPDGSIETRLELPLQRLWLIVRDKVERERPRVPNGAAEAMGEKGI